MDLVSLSVLSNMSLRFPLQQSGSFRTTILSVTHQGDCVGLTLDEYIMKLLQQTSRERLSARSGFPIQTEDSDAQSRNKLHLFPLV